MKRQNIRRRSKIRKMLMMIIGGGEREKGGEGMRKRRKGIEG